MEPAWMQKISSSTICSWFYTFYMVNAVILAIVVIGVLYALANMKKDLTVSTPLLCRHTDGGGDDQYDVLLHNV